MCQDKGRGKKNKNKKKIYFILIIQIIKKIKKEIKMIEKVKKKQEKEKEKKIEKLNMMVKLFSVIKSKKRRRKKNNCFFRYSDSSKLKDIFKQILSTTPNGQEIKEPHHNMVLFIIKNFKFMIFLLKSSKIF